MNRKILVTLTALLLVCIIIFSVLSPCICSLFGSGTSVGGEIASDTTWGPQGSPYNFKSDVTVATDVTLTILPGAVVNLALSSLIIDGTLYALGTPENRIMLQADKLDTRAWPPRIYFSESSKDWDESSGRGCAIVFSEVHVPGYQYSPIIGDTSKARISNNIIYNYGNDESAVRINGVVTNNTILGGARGITAWANTSILYNTIRDADIGISCGYMSTDPIYHPIIIGNIIINNTKGIWISGSAPYIAYNTITDNQWGIVYSSYNYRDAKPVGIINNNIYDNEYNAYIEWESSQNTLDMANNWWGTSDTNAISQKIYDNKNYDILAKVNFTPILNEPASKLPSNLPDTLSLIPQSDQYYAIAAFACGALVGVVALVIWIKKGKDSVW